MASRGFVTMAGSNHNRPTRRPSPTVTRNEKRPIMDALTRSETRWLKRITRSILTAGFGAAIVVYLVDLARPENPLGYDPLQTKKYRHDLEMYGGKANVLAAELREWFVGLWYGRHLAFTIAVITVLLAVGVRFVFAMRAAGPGRQPGDAWWDRGDA